MTDSNSLRQKATSGIAWSAFERFAQQGVGFFVQLILARLIVPEQFGLIALVIVFIGLSHAIVDSGFSQALIQRKELTDRSCSTVFFFNLLIAFGMFFVLWSISGPVASFYDEPELATILPILSLGVVIGAYRNVHSARLNREMHFRRLFWVSMPSTLIGGSFAMILAFHGYGVWALVVQTLVAQGINAVMLRFLSGWAPSATFSFKDLKEMFPYAWRLAASGILDTGFNNIYVLIIGKFYSTADVAFYQRAKSLQQLPVANLQSILMRVAFPLFSSIQSDPVRLKRALDKALQISCLLSFTMMATLAAVAAPLIQVLVGEVWLPAAPYLQLLCFIGALYPLHAMNLNVLKALGRSDAFLRLEIIKKLLVVINVMITYRMGITAMIYGMIITSLIALYVNSSYTKSLLSHGFMAQIRSVSPTAVLSAAMFVAGYLGVFIFDQSPMIQIIAGVGFVGLILLVGLRFMSPMIRSEITLILNRLLGGHIAKKCLL